MSAGTQECDACHHCSVLVVDDDPDVRELLRLSLELAGYRVSTVADGREALHHLRSHADTCMILLDLVLPPMDGAAFRKAQQRDRSLAWTPVLVLSDAPDGRERAREIGARAFHRQAARPRPGPSRAGQYPLPVCPDFAKGAERMRRSA